MPLVKSYGIIISKGEKATVARTNLLEAEVLKLLNVNAIEFSLRKQKPWRQQVPLRNLKDGDACCGNLFKEFVFEDLVEAKPPREKGLYAIRIKKRSDSLPEAMISEAKQLIAKVGWKMLEKKIVSRIERLRRIGACPTIYIGSAGTQRGSRNTLKGRYNEFSGRHTAMYPTWVLLYFRWKLEFGWKECDEPSLEETKLKEKYQRIHQGRLPALVER